MPERFTPLERLTAPFLRPARSLALAIALLLFGLQACDEDTTDAGAEAGGTVRDVASVVVSPDTQSIFSIGATVQLSASALDEFGHEIRNTSFSWASSNPGIATVSSDGEVTGVSVGSATISATSQGIVGSAAIWVDPERTLRNYCVRCHVQGHEKSFATLACPACHGMVPEDPNLHHAITNGHGSVSSGFELLGAHSLVACVSCHDLSSGERLFNPASDSDCIACHADDYQRQHTGTGFPIVCLTCHTTTSWGGASFDHATASGGFALLGAHEQLVCTSCHDPVSGVPLYSPNDQNDCIACHDDDYQRQHAAAGFPTTCLVCHTVDTWAGATFDHDNQFFPIFSGQHDGRWSGCDTCHTNPSDFGQFTCFNCHEHSEDLMNQEHADVTGFVYESRQCIACHPDGEA